MGLAAGVGPFQYKEACSWLQLSSIEYERSSMFFQRLVFTIVLGVSDIALANLVCEKEVGLTSAVEDGLALEE